MRPWIRLPRAQSCSSLSCSARHTSSWVAWAIRLPAVAKVNIFILNNLAMLRCRISRRRVKSIANELSSTATGSGPSGSSLALHRYQRGYARRHSCNGAGFSKGVTFPPDWAIAANFEGFSAAMLQKGQNTIKLSRLHRVPVEALRQAAEGHQPARRVSCALQIASNSGRSV